MKVNCGVPQGTVLGPLLSNVAYDVVFRFPMPRGTTAIGDADDMIVVAEGDSVDAMQESVNATIETVLDIIRVLGLRLAVEKTQAVVFRRRYKAAALLIHLEGEAASLESP